MKKNVFRIAGLLLIAAFLYLLHWNTLNIPLVRDEGEYAYSGWLIGKNILPYQNSFMQKPPMIIYTYALAGLFNSDAFWPARTLSLIFAFFSMMLVGLTVKKIYDSKSAWASMWLLAPMLMLPMQDQFGANVEQFLILPLAGLFAISVYKEISPSKTVCVLAGIIGSAAFLYKYTAIPLILAIVGFWAVGMRRKSKNASQVGRSLLWLLIGFVAGSLLILSYFLVKDGGASLVDATIVFNQQYISAGQMGMSAAADMLMQFGKYWWILLGFLLYFIFVRPKRWGFLLTIFTVAAFSSFGSLYGHYYVPLTLFWAAICGIAIADISRKLSLKMRWQENIVFFSLIILTLAILLFPLKDQLFVSTDKMQEIKLAGQPFGEAVVAAEKVRQLTSNEDRILVAGSEPEIYYYSKRLSSTRFVIFYPLTLPTPLAEGYQRQAIDEIESNPPKFIVLVQSNLSWLMSENTPNYIFPSIMNRIRGGDYVLKGGYVKSGPAGQWTDEISKSSMQSCSLLLFQKK
jgi:hypothetical protein